MMKISTVVSPCFWGTNELTYSRLSMARMELPGANRKKSSPRNDDRACVVLILLGLSLSFHL